MKQPASSVAEQVRPVTLNDGQRTVYESIMASREKGGLSHLIFGITGSGKTEIYIEVARRLIAEGLSVIYLVPEISLSSMIFERLYGVFGEDLIMYHSHLTPNQRLYNWIRFYRGEARVAVGTRSAVFLQCPALGMIVIDEEHDGSYKEHSTPRYNARRMALYRSRAERALVVMGSATPAVETLYACERGLMKLHTLDRRFGGAALPEIEIVKINSTKPQPPHIDGPEAQHEAGRGRGPPGHIPPEPAGFRAYRHLRQLRLDRGVSPLQYRHELSQGRHMLCHYCGHQRGVPGACEKCGSGAHGQGRLRDPAGGGDHRVRVQGLPIFRLDQDSSRKKETVPELIGRMNSGRGRHPGGDPARGQGIRFS